MSAAQSVVPEKPDYVRIANSDGSPLPAALGDFAEAAAPLLSDGRLLTTRCVNASWITARTLRWLGLPATVVCVDALIANDVMRRLVDQHGGPPCSETESLRWRDDGAWIVQTSPSEEMDASTNRFGGHVVVLSGEWLVDTAASQFHRPSKRIASPEVLIARTPDAFISGEQPLEIEGLYGEVMMYRVRPGDRRHEQAAGFSAQPVNVHCANQIQKAISVARAFKRKRASR